MTSASPPHVGSAESGPSPGPWASRPFRLLFAGQTVSAFGNAVTPVAVAFAVLELGGTATQLGLVIAAYASAQVVTTLLGGVLGDRLSRAALIQGASLASGVIQAVVAASLIGGWSSLGLLAGAGVLGGIAGSLGGPNFSALLTETVPAEVLQRAITWRRLGVNAAMVGGFAAAGLLVAAFGPGWAVAADALSFLVAAVLYSLIRVPAASATPETPHSSLVSDTLAGIREVARHTWLWVLIAQALVFHLVYSGAQAVLGPIVVQRTWGEAAWGWALAMLMVGFIVGGLLTLVWRPRHALGVAVVMLALTGAFPAAMAVGGSLGLLLAGAFLHGLGLEFFAVTWDLSIQQQVAPEMLARVYSVDIAGSFLARPIGLALTGPVAEAVGFSRWLWVAVLVTSGTSLFCAALPSVRRLTRTDLA